MLAFFQECFEKAFINGVAGMGAQIPNIFALMWMRTIMEYQYRHGGTLSHVFNKLYAEGGVQRFYRGLAPALVLAPVSRFGDTAANELAIYSLNNTQVPMWAKTACASATAAAFRLLVMPLDSWKVMKQVHGDRGLKRLLEKARKHPTAFWHGGAGSFASHCLGHYPFFLTQNTLKEHLPEFNFAHGKHVRFAVIGFASAVVSDSICNPVRVLKVNRQTADKPISYMDAFRSIVEKEGVSGLWGRGLKTRVISNGIQGALFTVMWRSFAESLDGAVGSSHAAKH